jgi:hypothetical protein
VLPASFLHFIVLAHTCICSEEIGEHLRGLSSNCSLKNFIVPLINFRVKGIFLDLYT